MPLVIIAGPIKLFNKYCDWNYENEINFDPLLCKEEKEYKSV